MISEPVVVQRTEQPAVVIRGWVIPADLGAAIQGWMDEVAGWLANQGVAASGAPFVRYHVINMAEKLDIAVGFPVSAPPPGDERIKPEALPAGSYATLLYTGEYGGLREATAALLTWAESRPIRWDQWPAAEGDVFRSRYETYITDPAEEPDPSKWETEIAIKIAEG
ncbi:MAG: GyrI-like domain-containing protein [Chloroflexi bacterium]|nr:GyrI-like domain-containing protein [Chloroflexota bacterium]